MQSLLGSRYPRCLLVLFLAAMPLGSVPAHGNDTLRIAVVQLDETAESVQGPVRLGAISRIWSTDPELERSLSGLDLTSVMLKDRTRVTAEQVRVRLQLAGYDAERVRVVGVKTELEAKQTNDSPPSPFDVGPLMQTIRDAAASRWEVDPQDVVVEPKGPVAVDSSKLAADVQWEIMLPERLKPGLCALKCMAMDQGTVLQAVSVRVDLTVFGEVPIAVQAIPRERTVVAEDIRMERRPLATLEDRKSSEEVVGKVARQPISSGQVVRVQFLTAATEKHARVVEPRAVVRLTARKGGLMVVISGAEALQGGTLGDWIRVRNPQSGKVITGKITGPDEVEVPL